MVYWTTRTQGWLERRCVARLRVTIRPSRTGQWLGRRARNRRDQFMCGGKCGNVHTLTGTLTLRGLREAKPRQDYLPLRPDYFEACSMEPSDTVNLCCALAPSLLFRLLVDRKATLRTKKLLCYENRTSGTGKSWSSSSRELALLDLKWSSHPVHKPVSY
jgi:hypothetical protein